MSNCFNRYKVASCNHLAVSVVLEEESNKKNGPISKHKGVATGTFELPNEMSVYRPFVLMNCEQLAPMFSSTLNRFFTCI